MGLVESQLQEIKLLLDNHNFPPAVLSSIIKELEEYIEQQEVWQREQDLEFAKNEESES